jgi:hypothetical protein
VTRSGGSADRTGFHRVVDGIGTGVREGVGSGVLVEVKVGAVVGLGEGGITALHASSASARAVTAGAFLIDARSPVGSESLNPQ